MNPWFESLLVVLLALAGAGLGWWFSRLPKPYWGLAYLIPLALVLLYGVATQKAALGFVPPVSWMMMGRNKYAVTGFIATMLLATPLPRLRRTRERRLVVVLMVVLVLQLCLWPCLAPVFARSELARLKTRIDGNGVCRQTTAYNCGPAAAVTALRRLGFPAEEGEIAILSGTSSAGGTEPDILAEALQDHYGEAGLVAEYRLFKHISELEKAGLTLAVIKYGFLVDHYVTVLKVTDSAVIVGDPSAGLRALSYAEFRAKWRFRGVVLRRRT